MNKTKKLLSVLLAVVMILSTMAISASAYQAYDDSQEAVYTSNDTGLAMLLTDEQRASWFCDLVNGLLATANIKTSVPVVGTIDFTSLDALCDTLSSYAGFTRCRLVVVFDGYKQKGNPGEKRQFHNIQVVYTKEGETADAYIEALAHEIGRDYAVRVASSDGLVQLSSFGSGVLRLSARELWEEVENAREAMKKLYQK